MPRSYPKGVRNKIAYDVGSLRDDRFFPMKARDEVCNDDHVAALNGWADKIAAANGKKVPHFDPRSGGKNARVLVLLQDPSRVAQHGSRFISRDNNDRTAHNTAWCEDQVGLAYEENVHWNVIPWWVKDPDLAIDGKLPSLADEARAAGEFLHELIEMLPNVTKVLLVGGEAQRAWARASRVAHLRELDVKGCPHTSPLAFNRAENQALTLEASAWAAEPIGRRR